MDVIRVLCGDIAAAGKRLATFRSMTGVAIAQRSKIGSALDQGPVEPGRIVEGGNFRVPRHEKRGTFGNRHTCEFNWAAIHPALLI
jgi:hypothetical protein